MGCQINNTDYNCWIHINGCTKFENRKTKVTNFGKQFRESQFVLNPNVTFCNNGAFSAVPKQVLDEQAKFKHIQETDPESWFRYEAKKAVSAATDTVAEMFGSNKENLVLVENVTTAANTVMKSIKWTTGDKLLITTHTFLCVKNTAMFVANNNSGVEVVIMDIKLPIVSKNQLIDQLKDTLKIHNGIKLVILDHITGPSAILMPIDEMIPICQEAGALVLVDGAHAPGQVKLELEEIGADFYMGNLHKWCFSARGCGLLYVNPKHSDMIQPVVTTKLKCSRLRDRFVLQGTKDYTSICAAPAAVGYLRSIGGLSAVKEYNEPLLSWATDMLCEAWNTTVMSIPNNMRAPFMILIRMPDIENVPLTPEGSMSIASSVYQKHKLHISATRVDGRFWLRLSAQIYNTRDDYYKLRDALMNLYQTK